VIFPFRRASFMSKICEDRCSALLKRMSIVVASLDGGTIVPPSGSTDRVLYEGLVLVNDTQTS
jgi:hypothetical protein